MQLRGMLRLWELGMNKNTLFYLKKILMLRDPEARFLSVVGCLSVMAEAFAWSPEKRISLKFCLAT